MLPQRTYIGPRADTEEIYAAHFRDQSENSIEGNVIAEETHNCYFDPRPVTQRLKPQ
jgi:hypothetical protein